MINCQCNYNTKEKPCSCGFAKQKAKLKIASIPKSIRGKTTRWFFLSVEFDTPANRIIQQLQPKNQFRIDTSLPDLAFLRQLSVQGRLRFSQATDLNANPITITPATGETFFFYRAEFLNNSAVNSDVAISNDGNTRYSMLLPAATTAVLFITTEFIDSLVGNGVKTFDITASNASSLTACSVFGWVENTSRIRDVTT